MPDGDGINPAISLGVTAPQAANPLAQLSGMMDLQGKLNTNAQFQQTFQARQRAGQIIASAPDVESGMQGLMKDPQVAPFAGSIISEYKQGLLANAQYQGEIQKQSQSGLEAVTKSMLAGISDPKMLLPSIKAQLAGLSPEARSRVEPAVNSLASSLLDGLPSDPAAAKAMFTNRQAGIAIAAGHTPASVQGLIGDPTTRDTGGAIQSGVQLPAQLGGGFQPANSAPKTLAPQLAKITLPSGAEQDRVIGGGAGLGLPSMAAGGQGAGPGAPNVNALGGDPSGVISTGPSLMNKGFAVERSKDLADQVKTLDGDVTAGGNIMKVVSEAREAQQLFKAGGGADMYTKVARIAQSLGVDPATVDKIGNGNLGSSELFDKLMLQTVTSQIKQQLPEGSRMAQQEFQAFLSKNPGLETDPRAIEKVFNFWTNLYKQKSDEQQSFQKYSADPKNDLNAWPAYWNKTAQEKGYITPEITNNTGADYKAPEDMVKDYKAGKITRAQAKSIAAVHGWAQ